MDEATRTKLETAAFRGLVEHLQKRTDVQNVDLMNLSGFCRTCLSKWYLNVATDEGVAMDYDQAREIVYGMPFDEWKKHHQQPASDEQMKQFETTRTLHADVSGHNKS